MLAQDRVADLEVMISLSDCIIVPAESLMELIQKKYNDCKVVVIEDPVEDFTLYLDDEKWRGTVSEWIRKIILQPWLYKHREKFNLVWFGAAQGSYKDSGLLHLGHKSSVLNAVNKTYPLTLTIISNSYYQYSKIKKHFDFPTCYMPWSLQSFAKVLKQHDCSIIPVDINEFTKVKSNNRAIQALYYHVPVIADPIASYIKLSDCMYINDWENNLLRVINNTAEKEEKLENASAYIEKYHTQAYITSKWLECFKEIEAHD